MGRCSNGAFGVGSIIDWDSLGRSPFLSRLGPEDRKIWRIALALLCGLVSAIAATVVLVIIATVVFVFAKIAGGSSAADVQDAITHLLDPKAQPTYNSTLVILVFIALANGCMFSTGVIVAALVGRRKLREFITAARRFRWSLMIAGMVLMTVVVGPLLALEAWLDPEPAVFPLLNLAHTFPQRVIYVIAAIVCLLVAAGVEELLCRGWLLRQTAAFTRRFWVLALVNGFLFAALHFPDVDPNAFIGRMLMGMGFTYMALRTGGIEFSTGAHAANNILLLLFVQTMPITPPPPEPFSFAVVGTMLAEVLGYVVITEIVVRWTPLREWTNAWLTPEDDGEAAVFA